VVAVRLASPNLIPRIKFLTLLTLYFRVLTILMSFSRIHCPAVAACSDERETTYAAVPDVQSQLLQLFGHARSTIALQAQAVLFTDMGQDHHIIVLTLAHRTPPPRTQPARCDLHNTAEKFYRPFFFPGFDERKPHPLPGSACLHA
jgi:hypothetical protein